MTVKDLELKAHLLRRAGFGAAQQVGAEVDDQVGTIVCLPRELHLPRAGSLLDRHHHHVVRLHRVTVRPVELAFVLLGPEIADQMRRRRTHMQIFCLSRHL